MAKRKQPETAPLPVALLAWMSQVEVLLGGCMAADPESKRRFEEVKRIGADLRKPPEEMPA